MRLSRDRREFLKQCTAFGFATLSLPTLGLCAEQSESESKLAGWTSFRDGLHNRGLAESGLPQEPKLAWEIETPDGTASTPVISDGRVYMGTLSGDLHCIDLKSGKVQWTYRSVEKVDPNSFAPGFNAPAALDATSVYIGDDQGIFHAVDRATGKRRWKVVTEGEIVGGAQVVGERVIFGSHDGFLYCHAAESGERIWRVETFGPVNGTPCVAGQYTFTTGCDKPILRVFDIEQGKQTAEVPIEGLLLASAAVVNGILYFGTDQGSVFALDWKNNKVIWEFEVANRDQQMRSSPAVSAEVVIVGSRDKHVYCIDRKSGELRWSFQTRAKVDSSPVIVDDRVFFGADDKNLYALNIADGSEAWKHYARQSISGSAAVAENHLVIGTDSSHGKILCFA